MPIINDIIVIGTCGKESLRSPAESLCQLRGYEMTHRQRKQCEPTSCSLNERGINVFIYTNT